MSHTKISVWGDSILRGIILDDKKMKYKYLEKSAVDLFKTRHPTIINNYSRFGCTISRAYSKIDRFIKKDNEDEWVLIEFGGNDCDFNWRSVSMSPLSAHEPNTPFHQFEKKMGDIARNILNTGKKPIFMTLPPIDSDRYFDFICRDEEVCPKQIMRFLKEKNTIYRQQERYSNAVAKVAHQMEVLLVDVRDAFLAQRQLSGYLCADGIHPNKKGQTLIADVFSQHYLMMQKGLF